MGKNIALLYMSAYFAQPAPEGSKNRFLRTQTNEAAVSALWKDPASRPDKIVALCSDTVRTKPTVPAADGSGNKVPTLEYFRDEFLKQLGVQPEQLVAVSVPDSMEEADQTRAISAVLEQVAENDNLYIDLSGGMRDTATLLLIVARYLKDIRMVQTKKVLYSELKGNSSVVRDSTGLYNLMDLITAGERKRSVPCGDSDRSTGVSDSRSGAGGTAVGSDPERHCGAGNRILPERAAVPQPDQPRHGQRG